MQRGAINNEIRLSPVLWRNPGRSYVRESLLWSHACRLFRLALYIRNGAQAAPESAVHEFSRESCGPISGYGCEPSPGVWAVQGVLEDAGGVCVHPKWGMTSCQGWGGRGIGKGKKRGGATNMNSDLALRCLK